ncbi:MAG: VWA domain-containing protein [Paludibacteraceae bacterium]|nr:VWA domain-containing protein [Paludibacteraceae bacterium]
MTFSNPGYLYLFLLLIPVIGWYIYEIRKSDASVQISNASSMKKQRSVRLYMLHVPFILRIACIILLTIALARPQLSNSWSTTDTEGIDIMMAIDVSTSMQGMDLKPNRLEAAKEVASEFVLNRPNDNIGLVVFAGESFTQCPLTTDHAVLINLFKEVDFGLIEDGTAIGMGLSNAVDRIKDSQAVSKVIILLTDGSNNRGDITPKSATELAKTFGIRVYTIGVGKRGEVPYPVQTPFGMQTQMVTSQFDEDILRYIATTTGGTYFRATDNNTLKAIYDEIDKMEKTKLRVREYSKKTDHFQPFLFAALACLLLELILRYWVLRTISN